MSKFLLFLSVITICTAPLLGQEKSSLEAFLARSSHGTGGLRGFILGIQNKKQFTERLQWSIGLEATINDAANIPLIYQDPTGRTVDGTIHDVTTGLQVVLGLEYSFIKNKRSDFSASLLPYFRYQATSINDIVVTIFPEGTGLPIPVRVLVNTQPAINYSPGASFRLNYAYSLN